jgi:hypothetical protein
MIAKAGLLFVLKKCTHTMILGGIEEVGELV